MLPEVPYRATAVRPQWPDLPESLREAISSRLGGPIAAVRSAGGGFTRAFAAAVGTANGGQAFLKAAPLREATAGWYAREASITAALPSAVAAPRPRWTMTHAGYYVLCLDLIDGAMPELPWAPAELEATVAAWATASSALATPPLSGLPHLSDIVAREMSVWSRGEGPSLSRSLAAIRSAPSLIGVPWAAGVSAGVPADAARRGQPAGAGTSRRASAPPEAGTPRHATEPPATDPPRHTRAAPDTGTPRHTTAAPETGTPRHTTAAPETGTPRHTTAAPETGTPRHTTGLPDTDRPRHVAAPPQARPVQATGRLEAVAAARVTPSRSAALSEAAVVSELAALERLLPDAVAGTGMLHGDLRIDNVLIDRAGKAWLCDWTWPCLGAPWFDLVTLLVTAYASGAQVDRFLAGVPAGGVDAALAGLAGYWLSRAAGPPSSASPHSRQHQAYSGHAALSWLFARRGWS